MKRRTFVGAYPDYLSQRLARLTPEAAAYRLAAEELYSTFHHYPVGILIGGPAALVRADLLDRAGEDLDVLIAASVDPSNLPTSVGGFPVEYTCLDTIRTTNDPHALQRVRREISEPHAAASTGLSLLLKLNPFRPKDTEDLACVLARSEPARRYLARELPSLRRDATELLPDRVALLARYGVS